MILTEKYASHFSLLFSLNPRKPPPPAAAPLAGGNSNPFEQTLTTRLTSLLPLPSSSPSIPLSWLSRAMDLLTLTLTDLTAIIISDPSLADLAALSSHLDSSTALLDACNAVSSALDRILRSRLLLRLALDRILVNYDLLRRALSAFSAGSTETDVPRLRPCRGTKSALRRAIYAAEAVSDLVVRSALVLLGGRKGVRLGFCVSRDFAWAGVYNEIVEEVCKGICCGEIEAVKMSVGKLAVVVGGEDGGGELTAVVRGAVRGAEEAMEELTEGVDGVVVAVNGVFRAALETREAALQRFRVGGRRCN